MAVRSRQTHKYLLKMLLCLKSVWMCVAAFSYLDYSVVRFYNTGLDLSSYQNTKMCLEFSKMTYKCIYCYLTGYIIVFVLILKCARCHLNAFPIPSFLLVDRQKSSFPLRPSHKVIRYTNTFHNSKDAFTDTSEILPG